MKWLLSELDPMAPQDERFDAKVAVLIENVRHHVREEEHDLFPRGDVTSSGGTPSTTWATPWQRPGRRHRPAHTPALLTRPWATWWSVRLPGSPTASATR